MPNVGAATVPVPPDAAPQPPRGSLYAALSRQVRQAGLLERRTRDYAGRLAVTLVVLAAGWAVFVVVGDSWWQLAVAVVLAAAFGQVGFLAHDAGHRQIFTSRQANDRLGLLLANLAVGLSYGRWVATHNRHHAHPNQEGRDPDIELGALAFTAGQVAAHGRLARFCYRYQAYFFFPVLTLTAWALHADSAASLVRRGRHRALERLLFAAHLAGYAGAVFLVLSPLRAVVFILVHQGLLGLYLGCSFAPNHKGMPVLAGDDGADFLHRQVLTSRNVRGGRLTDLALGGLNYQIEHHLFPNMPRVNLSRA
jgi:fatty acid desaturase